MSNVKDDELIDAGDLRPSQLITNHGPGAIITMRNDSVMIYGCHLWPKKEDSKRYKTLHHELLEKKLKVSRFRMPLSRDKAKNLPCFSFPRWGVCKNPKCEKLQYHEPIPKTSQGFYCTSCEINRVKLKDCELTHAKFAVICPQGHIDEFPWMEWVHSKKPEMKCEKNPNPELRFGTKQESSALKDYYVQCLSCYAQRRCTGATESRPFQEMNLTCKGKRPWIGPDTQQCTDEKGKPTIVRGIQVRATSLWYSINMSALNMPKWLHPVNIKLQSEEDEEGPKLRGAIELGRQYNDSFEEIYDHYKAPFKDVIETLRKQNPNWSAEDIDNDIIRKLKEIFSDTKPDEEIPSQLEILNEEYDDFVRIEDTKGENYENEFELETSDIDKTRAPFSYLDSLKQVHRITSILALRGFTRERAPDPLDPDETILCDIVRPEYLKKHQWLPAVQNRGEGIFVSLNKEKLSDWEKDEKLQKRCKVVIESYAFHSAPGNDEKSKSKQNDIKDRFSPKFILLHTLSHLIIKSLAKVAGYDEPSLRERIYWDGDRNGILIYATGSSDGSLGGLVRLAQSQHFEKILSNAIQKSKICSRDPVCEDIDPLEHIAESKTHQLNGASCHSCCFVAETTCAFFNQFLDRWVINNENAGFFKDVSDE